MSTMRMSEERLPEVHPATATTSPTAMSLRGRRVYIGLGGLLSALAKQLGFRPCAACARRAEALDAMATLPLPDIALPFSFGVRMENGNPCRSFTGRCTGFGRRQCVVAPVSFNPDALTIEQCCGGWFQFPWIEICDGQAPRRGCGFCLW